MLPVIPDAYVAPTAWDDLERGQRITAQRQLARLVATTKAAGVRASGVVLDIGVTHDRMRFARARRADLIVMGTHGRSRADEGAPRQRGGAGSGDRPVPRPDRPSLGYEWPSRSVWERR